MGQVRLVITLIDRASHYIGTRWGFRRPPLGGLGWEGRLVPQVSLCFTWGSIPATVKGLEIDSLCILSGKDKRLPDVPVAADEKWNYRAAWIRHFRV